MRLPDRLVLPPPGPAGTPRGERPRRRIRPVLLTVVLAVVVAGGVVVGVRLHHHRGPEQASRDMSAARQAGATFLSRFVHADGRVVREDQGGDTVSEGQAYAMLIAVALDDRSTFDRVWGWTHARLARPDGLLSWHWSDGRIQDPSSAADADLDAARALVLAGRRFHDPALLRAGSGVGSAILAHETVRTPHGLVLTGGSWVRGDHPPYPVNPSYFSPRAFQLLGSVSGDPRWAELAAGARAVLTSLTAGQRLVPNWVQVDPDGATSPAASPDGTPPQFGLDAARVPIRYAESCLPADRRLAGTLAPTLLRRPIADQRAVYDLAGSPQVDYQHPAAAMGVAAAAAAAGDPAAQHTEIDAASALNAHALTYYGTVWLALGRIMLTTHLLGPCPSGRTPTASTASTASTAEGH